MATKNKQKPLDPVSAHMSKVGKLGGSKGFEALAENLKAKAKNGEPDIVHEKGTTK